MGLGIIGAEFDRELVCKKPGVGVDLPTFLGLDFVRVIVTEEGFVAQGFVDGLAPNPPNDYVAPNDALSFDLGPGNDRVRVELAAMFRIRGQVPDLRNIFPNRRYSFYPKSTTT